MADLIRFDGTKALAEQGDAGSLLAGYEPRAEEFDLRAGIAILRRHVRLIASMSALAVLATAYIVYRQPPQYRATAVIRLTDQRRAMTSGIEAVGQEVLGTANDPLLSQIEVLRTRTVARSVVDRLGLQLRPLTPEAASVSVMNVRRTSAHNGDTITLRLADASFAASVGGAAARAPYGAAIELPGLSFTIADRPAIALARFQLQPTELAVDSLLRNLRARPREKTDVVDVEFSAADPLLAQRVVNTVVEDFRALNARQAQDESRRRRVFLEVQLAEMDSLQAEAQAALSQFRKREEVFSSRDKFVSEQAGLSGLDVRRQELIAERRMFESLLNDLGQARAEGTRGLMVFASSPEISSNPVISTLFGQLLSYEAVRDSLTMGAYGRATTDPDVQRLSGQIAATRSKLSDALRGHVGALTARIAALDDLRARGSAQLRDLPNTEAEEVRFVQNVETIQKMADQLRAEYQKARVAEAVQGGQVEILDLASLPQKPVPTRSALKLALGLALGLLVSSGLAFGLEQVNTSIRAPDELEQTLAISSLAVIPRMLTSNVAKRRLHLPGHADDTVVLETLSTEAEAYRKLRTNLIFAQTVKQLRRLLITSASAGEGKSTVAANLAVAFARQGMRVLLVDADLRKPTQHKVFATPQAPGLTQVALGHESLTSAIQPTRIDNLYLLPAGTLPANPAELLGQPQVRALFERLSTEFDVVLVDSAPVAVAADAVIAATLVDGVLMVVRAGDTDRDAAQYAVQQITKVGGRVVGAVLNDPDSKLSRYGEKYSYHYRSYQKQRV